MSVSRGNALHEGKAKVVFDTDQADLYLIYFKDDATAFNGQKKGTLKDKGVVNNTISTWIFRYLEKNGIATHFVDKPSDREMLVHKVEIIPVEVVVRNRAAGSLVKRLGVAKGTDLTPPLLEYFYKSDALNDPLIGETHIAHFGWATEQELTLMREMTQKVNELLQRVFASIDLDLIDFKLEFGRSSDGKVLLADEFTPDGCRLWDRVTGEPMDKDRFRQDLGGVEDAYSEVLRRLDAFFKEQL